LSLFFSARAELPDDLMILGRGNSISDSPGSALSGRFLRLTRLQAACDIFPLTLTVL